MKLKRKRKLLLGHYKKIYVSKVFHFLKSINISPIILSLFLGSLSATSKVKAVRAYGVSLDESSTFALRKNHTNVKAPLLLLPSIKG